MKANPIAARVAFNMKALRQRRGMTGAQFVERCRECGFHLSQSTLSSLETGRARDMTVDQLVAVAAALEVAPAVLMDEATAAEILREQVSELAAKAREWAGQELRPEDFGFGS